MSHDQLRCFLYKPVIWMENVMGFSILISLSTSTVTGLLLVYVCMCVCVYTLTYNVGGHKHPCQRGALEESQQQENNGAVRQTHGHPQQTGQAGGHEEAVSTSQPGNTHTSSFSDHTHTQPNHRSYVVCQQLWRMSSLKSCFFCCAAFVVEKNSD